MPADSDHRQLCGPGRCVQHISHSVGYRTHRGATELKHQWTGPTWSVAPTRAAEHGQSRRGRACCTILATPQASRSAALRCREQCLACGISWCILHAALRYSDAVGSYALWQLTNGTSACCFASSSHSSTYWRRQWRLPVHRREAARRGVAAVLSEPPKGLVRVCNCAPARASHTHTCNSGSAHGSRRGLSHGATVGSMRMYFVRKVRGVCVARGSQSASSGHWNAYASCPSYLPTCDVAISHFGNLTFSLMTRGGAAEIVCAEHCRVSPSPKTYVVRRFARSILHTTALLPRHRQSAHGGTCHREETAAHSPWMRATLRDAARPRLCAHAAGGDHDGARLGRALEHRQRELEQQPAVR